MCDGEPACSDALVRSNLILRRLEQVGPNEVRGWFDDSWTGNQIEEIFEITDEPTGRGSHQLGQLRIARERTGSVEMAARGSAEDLRRIHRAVVAFASAANPPLRDAPGEPVDT
jgi:hypothetical protein